MASAFPEVAGRTLVGLVFLAQRPAPSLRRDAWPCVERYQVVHQGLVLYVLTQCSVERFHLSASEFPKLRPSAHQSTESSAFHVNRETCAAAQENTQNNGPQKISFFQSKNILVNLISFDKQLTS